MNAFGEHYLQDSYAAGHLINKGFVMAVAMEHVVAGDEDGPGYDAAKIRAPCRRPPPTAPPTSSPVTPTCRATGQADRAAGNVLDDAVHEGP